MTTVNRIFVTRCDITQQDVDAIVNAANSAMCGGGGVDGAIHRAAGPQLLQECIKIGPCEAGSARITPGFNLPAKFVIHAVGPVWRGGDKGEAELLASCHSAALKLANQHKLRTIVFPAISCGAYRFPILKAARIALRAVASGIAQTSILRAEFACFETRTYRAFSRALEELRTAHAES